MDLNSEMVLCFGSVRPLISMCLLPKVGYVCVSGAEGLGQRATGFHSTKA